MVCVKSKKIAEEKCYNLAEKYDKFTEGLKKRKKVDSYRIWTMWWQGEDAMPEIINACYKSLIRNSPYEVVLITKDTIFEYVDLPE